MELGSRRLSLLEQLSDIIGSVGGFWGWGRGRPGVTVVTPVSSLQFGFTPDQWLAVVETCFTEQARKVIQDPIFAQIAHRERATLSRSLIIADEEWQGSDIQRGLQAIDLSDFMTSVSYVSGDLWFCLTFFRGVGASPFGSREVEILELTAEAVSWLRPRVVESLPPETFKDITSRQRMVMMLLLEGMSRKQISTMLDITLHTVNDHCKELFRRFGVQSATELAARFLKSS